jgi:hypothetical protein
MRGFVHVFLHTNILRFPSCFSAHSHRLACRGIPAQVVGGLTCIYNVVRKMGHQTITLYCEHLEEYFCDRVARRKKTTTQGRREFLRATFLLD